MIESGVLDTLICTPPCDGATPRPCAHAQAESENTSPSSPSLWCELPEVIESTPEGKKLQEVGVACVFMAICMHPIPTHPIPCA